MSAAAQAMAAGQSPQAAEGNAAGHHGRQPSAIPVAPPGLLGAALAAWAWQTDQMILGFLTAGVLEGRRLTRQDWHLAVQDWVRLIDLVIVLVVGTAAFLLLQEVEDWFWQTLHILPVLYAPLPLAQLVSHDRLCHSGRTLAPVGGKARRASTEAEFTFDSTHIFVLLCLVSGASVPTPPPGGLIAMSLVMAWQLWSVRHPGWPVRRFLVSLAAAGLLTAGISVGLDGTETRLQQWLFRLITDWHRGELSPTRVDTALGSVGTLKLSSAIVLRVAPDGVPPQGLRLRLASYRLFSRNTWYAGASDARAATRTPAADRTKSGDGDGDGDDIGAGGASTGPSVWRLTPDHSLDAAVPVTITAWLDRKQALLPLPLGTVGLRADWLSQPSVGAFGAVTVEEPPRPARFQALPAAGPLPDKPPDADDLRLEPRDRAVIEPIAQALDLLAVPPRERLARVRAFFADGFRYTLVQDRTSGLQALEHFLLHSRSGHCEYFATATALLLRAGRIPTRYVVGYMARERDPWEGDIRVRQRHGHAWVQAYVGGRWVVVDTTPAGWQAAENAAMSPWRLIPDLWSLLVFRTERWLDGETGQRVQAALPWLLIPGFLFLAWRLTAGLRRRRVGSNAAAGSATGTAQTAARPDVRTIEQHLAERGWLRPRHQPLVRWLESLEAAGLPGARELVAIGTAHYRVRFGPGGASEAERAALDRSVAAWLRVYARPR